MKIYFHEIIFKKNFDRRGILTLCRIYTTIKFSVSNLFMKSRSSNLTILSFCEVSIEHFVAKTPNSTPMYVPPLPPGSTSSRRGVFAVPEAAFSGVIARSHRLFRIHRPPDPRIVVRCIGLRQSSERSTCRFCNQIGIAGAA